MLKLPNWLIRRKGDSAPTFEQLLERQAVARADLARSESKLVAADENFKAERSDTAFEAFEVAEKEAERFRKFAGMVDSDVAEAEAQREAERLEKLRQRRGALLGELTRDAILAAGAPLAQRRADLVIQLVEVDAQRLALQAELRERARELERVDMQLGNVRQEGVIVVDGIGRTPPPPPDQHVFLASNTAPVLELLRPYAARLAHDDPRRQLLEALMPGRDRHGYETNTFAGSVRAN
jgi:hypothetical protein